MNHTKSYLPNHPNPQFSRENFQLLNGNWDFAFDDHDEGIKNKWYFSFDPQYQITVPYAYQCESSNVHITEEHNIVWYHRTFEGKKNGNKNLLHFEGVDYLCDVFINGKHVGNHRGAYSRFSFDITNYINDGKNDITVRVYDDHSCVRPRGKQRWMDHSYECFYVDTTGIWKTVWLEQVSQTYLKSVKLTPNIDDATLHVEYGVEGDTKDVAIETVITYRDKVINKTTVECKRNIFQSSLDFSTDSATMKIAHWNLNSPNLYDIEFKMYFKGHLVDTVRSYFGAVKYETLGNSVYVNHHPQYLKLILDQGYWKDSGLTTTEEKIIKDITAMQEIGLNGCRKHEKIEDDLFYYYCDILGFGLWQEMPSPYEFRDDTIENCTREWVDIVRQHYNHPALMTYVIFNESWGVPGIGKQKNQQDLTVGLYYLTKSLDQTRFVISNDGWEHTVSDVITVHNYACSKHELSKGYSDFLQQYANNQRLLHSGTKRLFSDGYSYAGQPIVFSEFAGIAFVQDAKTGWGYGDYVNNEVDFLARFNGQVESIIENSAFCGYCITQLSDVEQEVNGLLTVDREWKVSKQELKNIISKSS